MRKTKRGFTIVELVIVIAVIGVLTAVLVPTFIHLSNKAKKASDESLVHNLNTALSIEYAAKEAPATMDDAIEGLKHQGYVADILVAKAEKALVYNLKENKFELESEVALEDQHDYWKIVENETDIDPEAHWSIYAKQGFVVDGDDVEVHSGFDAGKNAISSIKYTRNYSVAAHNFSQEVVIRTNSLMCDLTINAANDSVKHYGEAQSINVIAVKSASYHEYGASPFISINTGRIVLEDSAQVEALHVNSSSAILAIASNEQLPTVTIEDGVTTFTVQTTQDNNGQVIGAANVTVAAGGVITVSTETSALSGTTIVETKDEEDAKVEAITNSDLVFQVKGSWEEVAANARAVLNDYLRVYNTPTSVLPGGSSSSVYYTPAELSNYVVGLKDYYVEAGTIHIDVESITINGIELNATSEFGLSVGSKRQVKANYFKIENSKLYLAAPVAAFELNTNETLKINKTNVTLGDDVENTLTVKTIHNGKTGPEYLAHENDAYSFDISKAITNNYTSMAFNEITGSADGPIVTRKLYTFEDGTRTLGYGLTSIDGPSSMGDGNYGVWMYVTGSPVNSFEAGTHLDYSVYFMGADKTCALHFDIVD